MVIWLGNKGAHLPLVHNSDLHITKWALIPMVILTLMSGTVPKYNANI